MSRVLERSKAQAQQGTRKALILFVAAALVVFTMLWGVEIDPTLEALIAAVAPVIVAYVWPTPDNSGQEVDWNFQSGIGVATITALIVYVFILYVTGPTGPDAEQASQLPINKTEDWATILAGGVPWIAAMIRIGLALSSE
jgi:hypothetical protein